MEAASTRPLTERQQAVMERIDRRVPIKVIAQELGVSETRINQHIRALKDIYTAENLGDLVECYRADINTGEAEEEEAAQGHLSESAYSKKQIAVVGGLAEEPGRNDPGELVMSDVLPLVEQAPWLRAGEPRVVPRVLDGEHAVVGSGQLGKIGIRMRELFARALAVGASGILVAHNHPSGLCRPSKYDISATRRLKTIAEALDIELLDHLIFTQDALIFTQDAVYSMRAGGNF